MQQRELGTSGLHISTIGLGSWAIGGWMWGTQDDAASQAAIHAAVDHGVNWIDTAPIYGGGHSETIVGRAIKALPASRRPLVFTKFGVGDDTSVNRRAAGRADHGPWRRSPGRRQGRCRRPARLSTSTGLINECHEAA